MTTAADDSADEFAFEAFLACRAVPVEADGSSPAVATFAGAVRATATMPGRPNAALAELLATGLLTDQSSPSIRTAPSAGKSPRRSRVRKRRFAMFFPALLAKFLAAGAIAQAATGAGVAVVVVTAAGATGVLGDGAQHTISSVVSPETAAHQSAVPSDNTDGDTTDGETADTTTKVAVPTQDAAPTDVNVIDPAQPLGPQIAGKVHGGSVGENGPRVSDLAHQRNEQRKATGTATTTDAPEAENSDDDARRSEATNAHEVKTESGSHGRSGDSGRGHN